MLQYRNKQDVVCESWTAYSADPLRLAVCCTAAAADGGGGDGDERYGACSGILNSNCAPFVPLSGNICGGFCSGDGGDDQSAGCGGGLRARHQFPLLVQLLWDCRYRCRR